VVLAAAEVPVDSWAWLGESRLELAPVAVEAADVRIADDGGPPADGSGLVALEHPAATAAAAANPAPSNARREMAIRIHPDY